MYVPTTSDVATAIASGPHAFRIRYNTGTSSWEELRGQWLPLDGTGFQRYTQDALNALCYQYEGNNAAACVTLAAMSTSSTDLSDIQTSAASLLSYTPH